MSEAQDLMGMLVDDGAPLTLDEFCRLCAVERTSIVAFVDEGVLTVSGGERDWRFTRAAVRRARMALRLQRDLELNLAGVALALQLLDEIQRLRQEMQARRA
jgi:chaperone modulatory protein CbpM